MISQKSKEIQKVWGILLALVFYLAFIINAWVIHDRLWNLEGDGVNFLLGAQTILTDHYWPTWSPGTSFLIWSLSRTGLALFPAAKLLVAISGCVFIVATFFILDLTLTRKMANWGALLTSTIYVVLSTSVLVGSHMIAAASASLGLLFFLDRRNTWMLLLSGLFFGVAVTIRINYLSMLGLALLLLIDFPAPNKLKQAFTWCVAFLVSASPLFLVNLVATGSALDTGQWRIAAAIIYNPQLASQFNSLTDFLLLNPLLIIFKSVLRFALDVPSFAVNGLGWLAILGIPGLVLSTQEQNRPLKELSIATTLSAMPLALAYFDRAYWLFATPLLLVGTLYLLAMNNLNQHPFPNLAVCLFLVLSMMDSIRNLSYYYSQVTSSPDYEQAGAYVRSHLSPQDSFLLAGQSHFAYYSGLSVAYDCRTPSQARTKLRFDYVVIDSRFEDLASSCLKRLDISISALEEVFRTDRDPSIRLLHVQASK